MKKDILVVIVFALIFITIDWVFAGTGGRELQSLWNQVTSGLQGFWGKFLALAFFAFAALSARQGNGTMAIVNLVIAIAIGLLPNIVNARYTLTF